MSGWAGSLCPTATGSGAGSTWTYVELRQPRAVPIKWRLSVRCEAASSRSPTLASIRAAGVPSPDDFVMLPDRITKESLGPRVRRADDQWFDVVRWSMKARVEAEELGV